ncbi:MFS transporter [Cupriavidus sp. 30B13]|uniref:MFS transporter n=1 Tax=Cupriavidus sp. 30B13 TaxID=3384241 RepID=UPI003B8FE244
MHQSHHCMARRAPGPGAGFWVAAAVVAHTLWTSAAPSMTYPLYASAWGLTPTQTTGIFAVYPIVVVAVLVVLGDLSDYAGRRATMLLGLSASLAGTLLFAAAPGVMWLYAGRAFMGIGVGLSAGPATAAMFEFAAESRGAQAARFAGALNTSAQASGLAAAVLVGGGLIQYAPAPMHLNFWVLAAVLALIAVFAWRLPRRQAQRPYRDWRFRPVLIPAALRPAFLVSMTAVTTAYAIGPMMLSVGAQIVRDLVGSANVFVNGMAIGLFAFVWGVTGLLIRGIAHGKAMRLGAVATLAAMAALVLAASLHSLPWFVAVVVASGMGYSLLFTGGIGSINSHALPAQRGGVLSALYLVGYLVQGALALGLGVLATAFGLRTAVEAGAGAVALLALASLLLALKMPAARA